MGLAPFLQTTFWPSGFLICVGLELSPHEGQLKGIVLLFSFVPLFLLFLLFFMIWSSFFLSFFLFIYLFFSTCCFLFFVLRIPPYTYALRELKMLIFFLHLVTYACNTLMYLKKKFWKRKSLTLLCKTYASCCCCCCWICHADTHLLLTYSTT